MVTNSAGTPRPRLFTVRVLAALTCGVLLMAACSSGDDDSPTASPSSTSAAASSTAPAGSAESTDGKALDRYADYETTNYADPAHWVCRPDAEDVCDGDLSSTTVTADGTLTVEEFEPAEEPAIDCFYVYPTISRDQAPFSDWNASDDEEGFVTLNQAARLQSQCRLFAPVYRQRTLAGLTGFTSTDAEGDLPDLEEGDPYADVLDAFRTYMANDNGGRGVVLIGHSQGAAVLSQLIAEEIDPNDDVRELLISAYLAGWSVAVPEGADVGGQFQNVPVCRTDDQTGCVLSWASFAAGSPPPAGAFFGRPISGTRSSGATQPADQVAVCTNPADLAGGVGGEAVETDAYFPANREASILSDLGVSTQAAGWLDPAAGEITTPFVSVPGLARARCVSADGFTYLEVETVADPADPRADEIPGALTPEWGLHLIDVNVVMGDVVRLVEAQAEAFAA